MCSADAVPSAMSFQLFKDNVPMETSDSGMWAKPLSEGGVFAYKCVANNSIGSTSSTNVSITVNGKWGSHILSFKHFSVSKTGKTNMQLALQHCCKSNVARLPPKFKPVNNLICEKTGSLLVKMCNIATQIVLQQCCKASCMFSGRLFYRAFKNDLADSTDTQSELYVHCYDCNDWETVWKKFS